MSSIRTIRPALLAAAAAALAAVLTGCGDDAPSTPTATPTTPTVATPTPTPPDPPPPVDPMVETGHVRFARLTLDDGAARVVVDDEELAGNVSYPGVSDYVELEEGDHRIQIFAAGASGAPTSETVVSVAQGTWQTVAAVGDDPIELVTVQDGADDGASQGQLRLFNAVPDYPPSMDLGTVDSPSIVTRVFYLEASGYEPLAPGTYTFELRRAGTAERAARRVADMPASGTVTVFAIGSLGRGDIDMFIVRDF